MSAQFTAADQQRHIANQLTALRTENEQLRAQVEVQRARANEWKASYESLRRRVRTELDKPPLTGTDKEPGQEREPS